MPTVRHNVPEEPLTPFRKGLVSWRRLTPWLEKIWRNTGIIISVDNLDIQAIPAGVHIKAAPAASAASHPFLVTATVTPDGTEYTVAPGSVGGLVPTLGGTLLSADPPPVGDVDTGTRTIAIKLTLALNKDVANEYVTGWGGISAAIIECITPGSLLLTPATDGIYHIPLATFVNGEKTGQLIINSLNIDVEDDGTGDGAGRLLVGA